jgi:hypothetical protein
MKKFLVLFGVVLTVALSLGVPASAQQRQSYRAFAVSMPTGTAGQVDIVFERWSSEAERETLTAAFNAKGQDGLLSALQKVKPRVGYYRTPNSIGIDIRFAKEIPGEDGGRRIIFLTDRRIGFTEARNRPRTIDYPFTMVEMRFDKNGVGEGRASVMTMITHNKKTNQIELENYSSDPVRLTKIEAIK